MADTIALGQKARILVNGANPSSDAVFTASGGEFTAEPADADGNVFLLPLSVGTATLTVQEGVRTGSDDVTVTDAPLTVTLDTPVPA